MKNLEKKNDIEKYSEKKSYIQPSLKEIGKIAGITKGSGPIWQLPDSVFPIPQGHIS